MQKSKPNTKLKTFMTHKRVWFKNKFPVYVNNVVSKLVEVAFVSLLILLLLRLFGFTFTWPNYFSAIAIYFTYEELEIRNIFKRLSR